MGEAEKVRSRGGVEAVVRETAEDDQNEHGE